MTQSPSLQIPKPSPQFNPHKMPKPGGSIDTEACFYIKREADYLVRRDVMVSRALVTLLGARQSGKTSLMHRTHVAISQSKLALRSVFIDVQEIPESSLQASESTWRYFADCINEQLDLTQQWTSDGNHVRGFQQCLKTVFAEDTTPLLICLDEVDRFFATPLRTEFFSTLRAFYNKGAFSPTWKSVRWLLSSSSEPSFFIEDISQSPFNIGIASKIKLDNFNIEQIKEFSQRLGVTLLVGEAEKILVYLGGKPYLVHLLLYHIAQQKTLREMLYDGTSAGQGIFREHLSRFQTYFEEHRELADAMRKVLRQETISNRQAERLTAAGLIECDVHDNCQPACDLYKDYFSRTLAKG